MWAPLLVAVVASCEPVPGAELLLRPGAVLLLGEIHGTEESPAALSKLACLALENDLQVTVALELPVDESGRVARLLSGGETSELLSDAFWSRTYQDGRSSAAMLGLLADLRSLRSLRSLRGEDTALEVILIDEPPAGRERDRFMAGRLGERVSDRPAGVILALAGNLHTRLSAGTGLDPGYEPMGLLLSRLRPEASIVSLQLTHGGGSAWICTGSEPSDCGTRDLTGIDAPAGIELYDEDEQNRYSGRYHLERITASPPASKAAGAR